MKTIVLSLGGSIVAPDSVDTALLTSFKEAIVSYLEKDEERRIILVVGGGAPARIYQKAVRIVNEKVDNKSLDWIGIRATRLNAEMVRASFEPYSEKEIVTDPTADFSFEKRVLVASGWKPGFSTDTDAVYLAKRFGSSTVVNLSNIKKVYTADPKIDRNAKPLDFISWPDFLNMVGSEWNPGANLPFDPVASKIASDEKMRVVCMDGRNIENLMAFLEGKSFEGTTISF